MVLSFVHLKFPSFLPKSADLKFLNILLKTIAGTARWVVVNMSCLGHTLYLLPMLTNFNFKTSTVLNFP